MSKQDLSETGRGIARGIVIAASIVGALGLLYVGASIVLALWIGGVELG